jgi:hypothetical protein
VTSIAEPRHEAGPEFVSGGAVGKHPTWVRAALLVAVLGALALQSPAPWSWLWLAVPAAVAVALLASWRYGVAALAVVALFAAALAVMGSAQGLWLWWIPAAAMAGAWMGLREEGSGPGAGQRAWMLAPALALAALLPWLAHYRELVAAVERELTAGDAQLLELLRQVGTSGDRLGAMQKTMTENAALRRTALPLVIPTVLFLWSGLLVTAGRALAARTALALRWPRLSRANLRDWRLPDAVLWVFLAGLALLVAPWPAWAPTGWTLLLNAGLGYCIQGVAVAQSYFLTRGVPPPVIIMTMLFLFMIAMPMFVLSTAALGLSDVWLDYRRLEPVLDGDPNEGDR